MQYTIPIKGHQISKDELTSLLSGINPLLFDKKKSDKRDDFDFTFSVFKGEPSGLAMDPLTAAIIIEGIKAAAIIVPSVLTLIGTVWVAYIQNSNKDEIKEPTMVIETDTSEPIIIVLNTPNVEDTLKRVCLPSTIEEITRIRLETSALPI